MLCGADTARLEMSAPLTHSDWMLRPGVEWGPVGVRHRRTHRAPLCAVRAPGASLVPLELSVSVGWRPRL